MVRSIRPDLDGEPRRDAVDNSDDEPQPVAVPGRSYDPGDFAPTELVAVPPQAPAALRLRAARLRATLQGSDSWQPDVNQTATTAAQVPTQELVDVARPTEESPPDLHEAQTVVLQAAARPVVEWFDATTSRDPEDGRP